MVVGTVPGAEGTGTFTEDIGMLIHGGSRLHCHGVNTGTAAVATNMAVAGHTVAA